MKLGDLVKDIEPSQLKGLKISTVGFLVAVIGLVLFVIGLRTIGHVIVSAGIIIGFIGAAVHAYLFFKK